MSNSIFVGIDPSVTNTGVVVLNEKGSLVLCFDGKTAYTEKKYEYDIDRYKTQADYIVSNLKSINANTISIAYEDYAFNSVHMAFTLGEYGGILKVKLLEAFNTGILLVAPMSNKKFATDYGYADKNLMMEQAGKECPELIGKSDDICDAYFLAKYAWYKNNPEYAAKMEKGNPYLRARLETVIYKKTNSYFNR